LRLHKPTKIATSDDHGWIPISRRMNKKQGAHFPDIVKFPDISLTFILIPDISLTITKIPDISRFSRKVVTLKKDRSTTSQAVDAALSSIEQVTDDFSRAGRDSRHMPKRIQFLKNLEKPQPCP
jgi:hypothetical protein